MVKFSQMAEPGRPTEYTDDKAEIICALLAVGKSIRQICAIDGMPQHTTILRWLKEKPEFRAQYARGRKRQARFYAEEIIDIADDVSNDVTGELKIPNGVAVQRAKLQIDTRKWIAAKLLPKKYGDNQKIEANHTGNVALQLVHSIPQPQREEP